MIKSVRQVDSDSSQQEVSANVEVDTKQDVTVEWHLTGDGNYVFARTSATVNPPFTTVEGSYTVSGSSDPHNVTARAGGVESYSTSLVLGGLPAQIP